jgi:hypothetical protein
MAMTPKVKAFLAGAKTDNKEMQKLAAEVSRLKAELAARDAAERERQLAASTKFKPLIIPRAVHKADSPGMPMTIWSDWHWGETVDKRETGGLNEFNRKVAEERVSNLVRNTISLLRDYSGRRPSYPGIWVLLGGDMVSGLIHEELVDTNWGNIADQAYQCGGAIIGGLKALAQEFGKVWLVAGAPGNHGRTTLKPTAKGRLDSYDRSVYRAVADQLSSDHRFEVIVCDDIDYRFKVYNTRFLLTHGDAMGVKGGDGHVGAYGPIIRGYQKLKRQEASIGRDFDVMVQGHWHQAIGWSPALPVITNGTLKGFDEFARTILRASWALPSQMLWMVSPKHGICDQKIVYC